MRINIIHILLFILSFSGKAQSFHQFPYYDFIKYDSNKIVFKGDTMAFENLYNKLDDVIFEGKGQINMLHIGGSHIQAGIWSGTIRENLQSLYPGIVSGRGLTFPYRAAKTTNPSDYTTRYGGYWTGCRNVEKSKACTLGLMGISVRTADPNAWIRLYDNPNKGIHYSFTKATVFHSFDNNEYDFYFQNDTAAIITHFPEYGYSQVVFSRQMDTLYFHVKKSTDSQTQFTCYGFNMESDQPGIYYNAIGNNGAAIPAYLRCELLEKHLQACKPDLVVLSIGINDAYYPSFDSNEYKANYKALIRRIKSVSPNCAILFTTNNDSYYKKRYANKNAFKVKQAMEELSKELDTGLWDMFTIMGGLNSIDKWDYEDIAKSDKIHFNHQGYELIGDLLSSALIQSYDQHIQRKFGN